MTTRRLFRGRSCSGRRLERAPRFFSRRARANPRPRRRPRQRRRNRHRRQRRPPRTNGSPDVGSRRDHRGCSDHGGHRGQPDTGRGVVNRRGN